MLILGSMPSVVSLDRQEYYGKTQNAFWRIMGKLFGAGPDLAYADRVARLTEQGVAVWDVLATCVRPGSLDSAIDMSSAEANDIPALLQQYPAIRHVFFNGKKSEKIYHKQVLTQEPGLRSDIVYQGLPSTSPAMAMLNFEAKLQQWQQVADAVLKLS